MPIIRVSWREDWTCAHDFDLDEAIAFANERLVTESQLPLDAPPEDVADALRDLDLDNALAEIEIEYRTEVEVERSIDSVEVC